MARPIAAGPGGTPRVDLLPRSEVERRERVALSAVWFRIVLLAILLALALVGVAFVANLFAQQRLAAEQSHGNQLIAQIGGLSDVSGALQAESELRAFRQDAMGSDLLWSSFVQRVSGVLPAGAGLVGFQVTPGAIPTAIPTAPPSAPDGKPAAVVAQAKKPIGLTGNLIVQSLNPVDIGAYSVALRGVEGVTAADAKETVWISTPPEHYQYTVDITFDQSLYSGRFVTGAAK